MLRLDEFTELVQVPLRSEVALRLVGHGEAVLLGAHVEVLAEGIAFEVTTHEKTTHIRMAEELDAEEVEHLPLQQVGVVPQANHGRNDIVTGTYLLGNLLHTAALVALGILKNIDTAKTFFAEVLAYDGHKVIEMLLVLQLCHLCGKTVKAEFFVF